MFFVLVLTSAVRDTSLVAAIIVGATYNRILAGTSAGIAAPDQLTSWWPSFVGWANRVARRVADRDEVNERRITTTSRR